MSNTDIPKIGAYKVALKRIASGDYNSFASSPLEWPTIIAYLALGGRIENGKSLDKVEDL